MDGKVEGDRNPRLDASLAEEMQIERDTYNGGFAIKLGVAKHSGSRVVENMQKRCAGSKRVSQSIHETDQEASF